MSTNTQIVIAVVVVVVLAIAAYLYWGRGTAVPTQTTQPTTTQQTTQ
jgi:cytoskeletal protein RodZ